MSRTHGGGAWTPFFDGLVAGLAIVLVLALIRDAVLDRLIRSLRPGQNYRSLNESVDRWLDARMKPIAAFALAGVVVIVLLRWLAG